MKKYGRKWRKNNPEEAKKKRNNPKYFVEKRQLKQLRKMTKINEVTKSTEDCSSDCELILDEIPITSYKQIKTMPFMPLSMGV